MKFKRTAVALVAGLAMSTAGFASASVLHVNGGVIQFGESNVTCDANGVKTNWGLETDDNSVRSVRISDIDAKCNGADLFIKVNGGPTLSKQITSDQVSFPLPDQPKAHTVSNIKVWIEG